MERAAVGSSFKSHKVILSQWVIKASPQEVLSVGLSAILKQELSKFPLFEQFFF
jgi:hypothetical protein